MASSAVKPSSTTNASRFRKRVGATILKRARDGSAFTLCECCNKNVPVVLIDLHSCSLDFKIRMSLKSQVVEKTVEIKVKKRKASSVGKGKCKGSKKIDVEGGAKKGKRPQSAFFLFMSDFRQEFKASHPDEKSAPVVGKAGGEKWRSMTNEEKKPYFDKAEELKADFNNGGDCVENNVADEEVDQEKEQPSKPLDDTEEDDVKNELDDDI